MTRAWNPRTPGAVAPGHPQLHNKFEASLGDKRLGFKKNKINKQKKNVEGAEEIAG